MIFVELSNDNGVWRFASEFHRGSQGVWKDAILQISPIEMGIRHSTGGYAYTNWGSITLVSSEIDLDIVQFTIKLYVGMDDSNLREIFRGYAYLNRVTETEVILDIYNVKMDVFLLEECEEGNFVDQSGNPIQRCVIGECIGTGLQHVPCLQFNPEVVGLDSLFKKMNIRGQPNTDYHVYDDGVDITDHVVLNYSQSFGLDVDPVGEVTISGSSHYPYTIPYDPWNNFSFLATNIFEWCRMKLGEIPFESHPYWGPYPITSIGKFVNSQETVIDFLDRYSSIIGAISYCMYSRYFSGHEEQLCFFVYPMIVAFESGIYATPNDLFSLYPEIEDYFTLLDQDFINWEIYRPAPIKEIRGEWTRRIAVTDRTGAHLKDERVTYSVDTGLAVGNTLNTYDFYKYDSFSFDVSILLNIVNKERFKIVYHLTDSLLNNLEKLLPGNVVGFYKPENCTFPIPDDKLILLVITNVIIDFEKYLLTIRGIVQ